MSASDRWGQHFVDCRRCEIGGGPSQDTFCPTGRALADRAAQEGLNALRDMNLSEYLLSIADEHFEEDQHRRILDVGTGGLGRPPQAGSGRGTAGKAAGVATPPSPYYTDNRDRHERQIQRERDFAERKLP